MSVTKARAFRWPVVFVILFLMAAPAHAHRLEPISTEFAQPLEPGQTNLEISYEYEREPGGEGTEHVVPEFELERALTKRFQFQMGMPLVRVKEGEEPATLSGGHLELGLRALLAGGGKRSWVLSFQPAVELPTGNRRLFGNGTEVDAAFHFDKFFARNLRWHTNLGLASAVSGDEAGKQFLRYSSAVVIPLTRRWHLAPEIIGGRRFADDRTLLAAQPAVVYSLNDHLELKFGLPVGLTDATPRLGVRSQIAIIWGGER